MARATVTRSLALLALAVVFPGCASKAAPVRALATEASSPQVAQAAPVRLPPTRPTTPPQQLWPIKEIRGIDCIDVRDVAKRFGLKLAWSKPDLALTLSDASGVRVTFESGQKDFRFDGVRIFLGDEALLQKGTLWLTKLDVIKIVAPLLRPSDQLAHLPVVAPQTIVIDPGHGGIDPGTQNAKLKLNEKTFTLDVALHLRKILEARGWRVILVREKDTELSKDKKADLLMRNELANRNKADLFLSIHFNSAPEVIAGVETYSMAPQFMLSAGDETGDDMTKVSYPSNRLDFANLFFGEQMHRAMIETLKTPDRGYKHARKAVLRMLDCPGVLVECGYISNDAEARRIATPEFRQQIAEGLAAGLQNYSAALVALRASVTPATASASK